MTVALIDRMRPWQLLRKALPDSEVVDFGFHIPMELVEERIYKGRVLKDGQRPIKGVASTPHKDLQSEFVVQKGLNTRYFLKHGYYNDDHQKGHKHKVGQPLMAEVKSTKDRYGKSTIGLYNEGFLWRAGFHEGADAICELYKAQRASDADRKMGFSIEGKVLQRDGNRILKAWVQDIAITASPINTYTWMDLVDDLGKSVWGNTRDLNDLRRSIESPDLYKSSSLLDADDWEELQKEEDGEEELKAMAAASNPLVPQSLEGNLKITTYEAGGCGPAKKKQSEVSKALRFSYLEARSRGWAPGQARQIALASVTRAVLS